MWERPGWVAPVASGSPKKFRIPHYTIYVEWYTLLAVQKGAAMIRLPPASRDPQTPLDPENWRSADWNGDTLRDCRGGIDCCDDDWNRSEAEWRRCYGGPLVVD